MALVAAAGVVVLDVDVEHPTEVTAAGMRIRSVHSPRTEEIHRSAIAFIRGDGARRDGPVLLCEMGQLRSAA